MHDGYYYILCVYIYLVAITQWMCWVSLKYWYNYHTLKLLSSPSRSNVLIQVVVHIIKTNLIMLIVQVLLLKVSWVHTPIYTCANVRSK